MAWCIPLLCSIWFLSACLAEALPARVGGFVTWNGSRANSASTSVVVPTDADMLLCQVGGYKTTAHYFSGGTMKIGGQPFTLVAGGDTSTNAWQGALAYRHHPPTGTQTLSVDWAGTQQSTDKWSVRCAFYAETEEGSPVRSSSCTQQTANPHITAMLTAEEGDRLVAWVFQFVPFGTNGTFTWTGATEVSEFAQHEFGDMALAEALPTSAQTVSAAGTPNSDGGICALVLAGSGDEEPPPPPPPPPGITLRDIDGGANYFAQFTGGTFPTTPNFFPIGAWLACVSNQADIDSDKAAGLNTYVLACANSNASLMATNGMHFLAQANEWLNQQPFPRAGWSLDDEVDMTHGPGSGYTVHMNRLAQLPQDNKPVYANYGKGVMAWESDSEAQVFINDFQDIVSADFYFFTDPNICNETEGGWFYENLGLLTTPRALTQAECRGAWNYGYMIDRLRQLDGLSGGAAPAQRLPMWGFVELGNPWTEDQPKITPAQMRAAVWHQLIAGARGIIYFNHTFGGTCQTNNILRDSCYASMRSAVTTLNSQITALAPVLNAPFADGYVTASSGVRAMAKKTADGTYYVFTGVKQPGANQQATFTVASGTSVEVLHESRTLPVANGQFSDTFADLNTIHIYKITGGQ